MDENVKALMEEVRNKQDTSIKTFENKTGELEQKLAGTEAEIFDLKQKMASFSVAPPSNSKNASAEEFAKMLLGKKEIRNLTQNGAGYIEVVSDIVRGMVDKGKITGKTRTFYGDNAQVNIPVFFPGLALPANKAQGATDGAADSTAAFGPVSLTPQGFLSILPIDRLALGTTSLEANLQDIFGDAYGQCWENQILNGAGSNEFTGIFDATWIAAVAAAASGNIKTAASATAVTWKEIAGLARAIKAKASGSDNIALLCHPDLFSEALTASGASPALELEYLTKGTIAGVPVIESTWAPNDISSGKYVACACNLNHYATAFVRDIVVDPIKVKGDLNIYEQACIYANGKPLVKDSFFYLKMKTA